MNQYVKFVKHILIVGSLDLLSTLQSLLFLPLITKILGAGEYGIWSQIKASMNLLVPFTFLGLQESIIRFLPSAEDKNVKEGIYSSSVIVFLVTTILGLALAIFSGFFANLFKFPAEYVKFLALIVVFEAILKLLLSAIRSLRKIKDYFLFMTSKMLGETGLVFASVFMGYGLRGAVVSFIAIRIIIFVILISYILKNIGFSLPRFNLLKEYFKFGLPTTLDNISYWVITSFDRYVIAFFWGIIFVGYYAPAYSIGMLLTFFIFPISFMLSVVLPKLYDEHNIEEIKKYLSNSLKYFLFLIIPSSFGLSVLSGQLLSLFSTREISENSYFVVPFVVFSILLYGVSYFFSQILSLAKKTKITAIIWMFSAIINILLNILFIPKFGILAAAITTFISYLSAVVCLYYFSSREIRFIPDWIFIIKSTFASMVMGYLIYLINPYKISHLIFSVVFGAFFYFFAMCLLKGFGKKEIIFLKNLIYEMAIFSK